MSAPVVVLGADVGGTKTKIALGRLENGRREITKQHTYRSADHGSFEAIVEDFLANAGAPRVAGACFAVAGPVEGGRARLTNLPWQLGEAELATRFGFAARLINDFAAAGYGIARLHASDLVTLQHGARVERAARVIVGAGTGLGVAVLTWIEDDYCVHASEGGHADFAPIDEVQDRLLSYLRRELGHVSYERVISGPALPRILEFLKEHGAAVTPALCEAMQQSDPSGAITDFAVSGRDDAAAGAVDLFVSAYGAFAGNMALVTLAHGGVYIAGGIAPKICTKLKEGAFMRAFLAKGRLRSVLETIPVHVVMNADVGLYGALAEAGRAA
jgi:glucokinase